MEKRIDIKTGFLCNCNCIFCVQASNKLKGNRSLEDIKKDLIESKPRCEGVVLTGGEVTIRKDFFELVRFAKELGYKTIQVQSNGRMFSSLEFCKKTIEAGATEFALAIHGHNSELHDSLTNAKGAFNQVVKGVLNLRKLEKSVIINCVVVKQNYKHLLDLSKLFVKLNVNQFQFAFVHAMGNAWNNIDIVLPKMTDAMPYIKQGIDYAKIHNIFVMVEAVPFCMMKGYEKHISENYIPETEIKGISSQNTLDFTKQRVEDGKIKFKQCLNCDLNNKCEGPWREYSIKYGSDEFIPIKK